LLGHITGNQHGEDRQHFLEQRRVDAGLFGCMPSNGTADVFRSENLTEHAVTCVNIGRFGRHDIVEQSAATKLAEQSAQSIKARRLFLCRLFETAENGWKQSPCPDFSDLFVDAQLLRD
jgi:hypothetical protein